MIENNRDEEFCRRWDVLADEDHTYHLSEKEYFYYKNKWWLHLNKSGSVYLRTFTPRRWRRTISALSLLEEQTMEVGIEFVLYMVGIARLLVVFLKFRKSRKRQAKS